jgi:hypothetical protein
VEIEAVEVDVVAAAEEIAMTVGRVKTVGRSRMLMAIRSLRQSRSSR